MPLSQLIADANAEGWLINNLFQLDDGSWQANLRSATHITAFGVGPDPTTALTSAMFTIAEAQQRVTPAPPAWSLAQPAPDLASILNLPKPKTYTGPVRRT